MVTASTLLSPGDERVFARLSEVDGRLILVLSDGEKTISVSEPDDEPSSASELALRAERLWVGTDDGWSICEWWEDLITFVEERGASPMTTAWRDVELFVVPDSPPPLVWGEGQVFTIQEEGEAPYEISISRAELPSGGVLVRVEPPDGWFVVRFFPPDLGVWCQLSWEAGQAIDSWHDASERGRGPYCYSQSGLHYQVLQYVEQHVWQAQKKPA